MSTSWQEELQDLIETARGLGIDEQRILQAAHDGILDSIADQVEGVRRWLDDLELAQILGEADLEQAIHGALEAYLGIN